MWKIISLFVLVWSLSGCVKDSNQFATQPGPALKAGTTIQSLQAARTTYQVRTVTELLNALKTAIRGDIIYIANDAVLNLSTLTKSLYIPAGVTLASGLRFNSNFATGSSNGAKLYLGVHALSALIRVMGDSVTIRGLRIHGPDRTIETFYTQPITCGIKVVDYNNLNIDHCEIAGWSYAGINFFNSSGGKVTNSYIHHNRRNGLGFGILLDSSSTLIADRNLMDNNRHCIGGSGHRTQSYEVKNSILRMSEPYPYHYSLLDMHGECEMRNGTSFPNSSVAGNKLFIHHNSIRDSLRPNIVLRGISINQSLIQYNTFYHQSVDKAIVQYLPNNFTGTGGHQFILSPFNNISVSANTYRRQ